MRERTFQRAGQEVSGCRVLIFEAKSDPSRKDLLDELYKQHLDAK